MRCEWLGVRDQFTGSAISPLIDLIPRLIPTAVPRSRIDELRGLLSSSQRQNRMSLCCNGGTDPRLCVVMGELTPDSC
jgi:hypothetical protein